jgi:LysR family transcriptional regulator, nitrogen assimilation regulatory protein
MNMRQLRYFVSIAQAGSFNAAADALHVAQSALSRHMKELEEELGGVLFDRGTRGVALSDAGKILFERARFILSQVEEARTEIQAQNQELIGTVRLMAPSSIGQVLFEPLLDKFLKQYPKVRLELNEGLSDDAVSRLLSGAVDVAILSESNKSEYIDMKPLACEQMILVGRQHDPIVSRKSISVAALAGIPLLLPAMTLTRLRQLAPQVAHQFNVSVFVESAPAIRSLVASGWGFAVVPNTVILGHIERRRLKGIPILGFETHRQIGVLRGRPISRPMKELTVALRREFGEFVDSGIMKLPNL